MSFFIGLVSAFILWLISFSPNWWLFVPAIVVWIGLLLSLYFYRYRIDMPHPWLSQARWKGMVGWQVILMSACALIALLVLLDWNWATYGLIALGGFIMFFLFGEAQKSSASELTHEIRPIRRILMMLWVFNLYAFSVSVFALGIFLNPVPVWLSSLVLAVIYGFISVEIWKLYFAIPGRRFALWTLVISLIFWEIIYIFSLLPLGYFISSLLIVWLWYMTHLLVRFHMGVQGIVWRKQIMFLIINLVLFLWLMCSSFTALTGILRKTGFPG